MFERVFPTKRIAAVLFVICVLLSAFALGEPTEAVVSVSAVLSPTDFVEPSDATLIVTVFNGAESALRDMRLRISGYDEMVISGELASGMTASYTYPISVTTQILSSGGLDVSFGFSLDGERKSISARADANTVAALPSARLTVSASSRSVRAGDTVDLVYYVENTGIVDIQSAVVSDMLGGFATEPFNLAAGESLRFQNRVTVSGECDSSAKLTYYSRETGTSYTTHAQSMRISLFGSDVRVTAEYGAAAAYGERMPIFVTVANSGSHGYRFLSLSDATLGQVTGLPGTLSAGESFTVSLRTPALKSDAKYVFTLSMRDENGYTTDVYSDEVRIAVQPAPVMGALSVSAAQAEGRPGEYVLLIRGMGTDIFDVKICERTLGELRNLEVLSANSEISVLLELPEIEEDEYRLYASYVTSEGTITAHAEPIKAVKAKKSAEQRMQAFLYGIVGLHNLPASVFILSLSLITVIALVVLVRRAWTKRERLKRRDELNKTSKFERVKKRDA